MSAAGPARFLLCETQGEWGGPQTARFLDDAVRLVDAGHPVCVYLVQDGVVAARPGASGLEAALARGVTVWVDDFSLLQRGLLDDDLVPGTEVVDMPQLAQAVLDPAVRVVWH